MGAKREEEEVIIGISRSGLNGTFKSIHLSAGKLNKATKRTRGRFLAPPLYIKCLQ